MVYFQELPRITLVHENLWGDAVTDHDGHYSRSIWHTDLWEQEALVLGCDDLSVRQHQSIVE